MPAKQYGRYSIQASWLAVHGLPGPWVTRLALPLQQGRSWHTSRLPGLLTALALAKIILSLRHLSGCFASGQLLHILEDSAPLSLKDLTRFPQGRMYCVLNRFSTIFVLSKRMGGSPKQSVTYSTLPALLRGFYSSTQHAPLLLCPSPLPHHRILRNEDKLLFLSLHLPSDTQQALCLQMTDFCPGNEPLSLSVFTIYYT